MPDQSQTIARPLIDNEWRRWIAENLTLGNPPQGVLQAMVEAGFEPQQAGQEVQTALNSPYFAGTQRMRNRLAKRDWVLDNMRRLNQMRSPEVPRLLRPSAEQFLDQFYSAGRPLIITGALDHWPAMKKWNFDYFINGWGEREVEVQFGRNGNARYEVDKSRHQRMMPFGEYTQMVRDGGRTNDYYMTAANNSHNDKALQEMWADIGPIPEYLDGQRAERGFLWFGPAGTITPFHHDLTNNFMAQIIGRKRVLIVPPWEIAGMYNDEHCFSQVDGRNIDYERFPAMRNVRVLECELRPGELLFLPAGCWHFVEGLDVSATITFINFHWDNSFYTSYPGQLPY